MVALSLLLVLFIVDRPCVLSRDVGPVTSITEMLNALRDVSVGRVFLGPGVFALGALSTSAGGGLTIGPNRNVELVGGITAQTISNSTDAKWPAARILNFASGIDFGSNAQGIFNLADNTTVGFRDLFLWNALSQLGYDTQVVTLTQPGIRAAVRFTQTVKVRDGCLPLQIFVQHVASYTRLADIGGQQAASLQPFCYLPPPGGPAGWEPAIGNGSSNSSSSNNATCLPEVLAIDDLATSILRSNGQSYSLYEQNSTYWCRAYVSMACLSASGPEQCVKELLATKSTDSASPPPSGTGAPQSDKESSMTSILLPAIITGVLALSFVATAVWCVHRRDAARRGSSLMAHAQLPGIGPDMEAGAAGPRGMRTRVGGALARLVPSGASWDAQRRKPNVRGYVPVGNREVLERIAKARAELSSKMVVASSKDDLSDVRNLQLVGKGNFGRVYKGEWKGVTVALKVISVPASQYGQAQWQHVLGEAAISTLLNHPCVLQTYSVALLEYSHALKSAISAADDDARNGASSDKGGATSADQQQQLQQAQEQQQQQPQPAPISSTATDEMVPFYQLKLVSEFCEGGSVVGALRRMRFYDTVGGGKVPLPAVIDIASQVASGMAYLHSANIIHADLKAANVLLKQQPGSGRLQAKVGDFGLSFRMEESEATHITKGQLGSITHMAPEVLLHGRVSKASDVYSFGILLYELYTGQLAYQDVPHPMLAYHVATAGGRPVLPSHCPAAYRALAECCWSSAPAARPTFEDVYRRLQGLTEEVNASTSARRPGRRDGTWGGGQDTVAETTGTEAAAAAAAPAAGTLGGGGSGGQVLQGASSLMGSWDTDMRVLRGCVAPPPSLVAASTAALTRENGNPPLSPPLSPSHDGGGGVYRTE